VPNSSSVEPKLAVIEQLENFRCLDISWRERKGGGRGEGDGSSLETWRPDGQKRSTRGEGDTHVERGPPYQWHFLYKRETRGSVVRVAVKSTGFELIPRGCVAYRKTVLSKERCTTLQCLERYIQPLWRQKKEQSIFINEAWAGLLEEVWAGWEAVSSKRGSKKDKNNVAASKRVRRRSKLKKAKAKKGERCSKQGKRRSEQGKGPSEEGKRKKKGGTTTLEAGQYGQHTSYTTRDATHHTRK
jgi:hypothetical protein